MQDTTYKCKRCGSDVQKYIQDDLFACKNQRCVYSRQLRGEILDWATQERSSYRDQRNKD